MTHIGKKIAGIRKTKGLTQEEVAEMAKINLRTLQRIEKGDTEPRGNSLKGICAALAINMDEIVDYGKIEDRKYLMFLHLSVLCFLFIPLGNMILPLILWLNKRDKVLLVNTHGKNILNFQLAWSLLFYISVFAFAFSKIMHWRLNSTISVTVVIIMYCINIALPVTAAVMINRGRGATAYPTLIRFIK